MKGRQVPFASFLSNCCASVVAGVVVLAFIFGTSTLNAQSQSDEQAFMSQGPSLVVDAPVNSYRHASMDLSFRDFDLYSISNAGQLRSHMLSDEKNKAFQINFGSEYNWTFQIHSHSLFPPGFKYKVGTANGIIEVPVPNTFTYEGQIASDPSSVVRMTLVDDHFTALVITQGHEYYIEPLKQILNFASSDAYIVYEKSNVISDGPLECGMLGAANNAIDPHDHGHEAPAAQRMAGCVEAEIALAANHDMVTKHGSVADVMTHITSITNTMEGLYTQIPVVYYSGILHSSYRWS